MNPASAREENSCVGQGKRSPEKRGHRAGRTNRPEDTAQRPQGNTTTFVPINTAVFMYFECARQIL